MANHVAWFEATGPDAGALQSFYAQLFDWKIDTSNPMGYGMVEAGEGEIGGGVGPSPDGSPSVTWYVAVSDLQAALDKANELGGKTIAPPMEVPGGPELAYFSDPAGNRIGLMKM